MSFIQKIQLGFEPRPVNIRIHYVSYYTIEYGIMIILILTLIYIYQRNRHTHKNTLLYTNPLHTFINFTLSQSFLVTYYNILIISCLYFAIYG